MKATSAILITTLAAAVFIGCDKKEPAAPKADAPKTEAPKSGTDTTNHEFFVEPKLGDLLP